MPDETENIPGLDAVREALVSAFKRQDFSALAALFATNATLLPPGTRIIKDPETIREFWASVGEQVNEIALEPLEISPLGGDAAREIGRIRMSVGDQSPQIVLNKYLLLWQRAEEGWLIASLIWNRIQRVQGGGRLRQNREGWQTGRRQIPQLYSR
jgi:ketosteroid isomerase-like protein